jgi:hypothetical protein
LPRCTAPDTTRVVPILGSTDFAITSSSPLCRRKTSSGRRSVARQGCGTVDVATGENGPGDPCHLVGERDRGNESWPPAEEGHDPGRSDRRLAARVADDGAGADHQQAPEVSVALFGMPARRCLPPLEFCRGTSPSQAASWRPELKHDGSVTVAAIAVAVIGPTPGIVASLRLASSRRPQATSSASSVAILACTSRI